MTSLLTNTTASATLRQMSATQRDLLQAQNQASSGLRVAGAADNAAYWSIGVAMRSQTGALSAVKDGLALNASVGAVSTNALAAIISQMNGIKSDLVAAQQSGVDAAAIGRDVAARQGQIISIADAASFNGQSWLVGQTETNEVIADSVTYNQSLAVVNRVNANASPSTESYTVTIDSNAEYTQKDGTGAAQTASSDTSSTFTYTYTDTVTVAGGVTLKTKSHTQDSSSATRTALSAVTGSIDLVQGYDPASGLSVASLSKAPLILFTNNSGTVKETSVTTYADRTIDNNLVNAGQSQILLSTSQSASYNTDVAGAADGILDQSLVVDNRPDAAKTSLLTMTTVGASDTDLATMLQKTDEALTKLTTAGAIVGALMTRIDGQTSFDDALSDALTQGVGALTDADMNTTATRIQALQTQQQLQAQALSIANQNTAIILKLFQ